MHEEKIEGIVLKAMDYQERHRIVTLFTPQGLISLLVRNISRKNTRLLSLTTPFCHGEYLYFKGRSELLYFRDGSILNDHFSLRSSLQSLQLAGALSKALLTSQMPGKPTPTLFALYRSYHNQVPTFAHPEPLLASFYLKLLKHEGLLTIAPHCASCETPPTLLYDGESFCNAHAPKGATRFQPEEWPLLLALDTAQQFASLRALSVPPPLFQKIITMFESRLTQ